MLLCNYLFYKGYELSVMNRSQDPVVGGIRVVGMWVVCNVGAFVLLLSHYFNFSPPRINCYIGSFIIVTSLLIYYSYKGRGRKIAERYKQMSHPIYRLNPYIVVFGALILAAAILGFVGSYINDFKLLKSIISSLNNYF